MVLFSLRSWNTSHSENKICFWTEESRFWFSHPTWVDRKLFHFSYYRWKATLWHMCVG
jgi:hypothetical protein